MVASLSTHESLAPRDLWRDYDGSHSRLCHRYIRVTMDNILSMVLRRGIDSTETLHLKKTADLVADSQ